LNGLTRDLLRALPDLPVRRLRLYSGIVLWLYIGLHMVNHTLGLFGLAAAEAGLSVATSLWHSLPGTVLLATSALVHLSLALSTLFTRRHWRLPPIEILRLVSGFSLPLLIIGHVVTTRVVTTLYGTPVLYKNVIANLAATGSEGWQIALLAPGWLHGCLGLWITLVRVPALKRKGVVLAACAIALPVLSAIGFMRMRAELGGPSLVSTQPLPEQAATLSALRADLANGYMAALVLVIVAGQIYQRVFARRNA